MPFKMSEIKEIYNCILNEYEYGYEFLHSTKRSEIDINFQTFYSVYFKNKYDRKSSKISSEFYDISSIKPATNNVKKLFVINTSINKYSQDIFKKEIYILNRLFPDKTPYELDRDESKENIYYEQKETNEIKEKELSNINNNNSMINFNLNLLELIERQNNMYLLNNADYNYKQHLEEEILYLKGICRRYNILNYILTIIFILLLIVAMGERFKTSKKHRTKYKKMRIYN